ncbi:emerin (Emery-Dreifuss muscular dystrophy) isoform X1 [Xiphias gladius]|uniref:emerin (Emery-Dreifuss muscular dystrophy) isoform X1 n=1 Tax=Xiphias gladius TaxID=8245 RepID=UPI001A98649F|nr:emerin (Emery-Dreifuss muscular dystrophy) isoform X1 [Xiphias gladius]
MSLSERSVEEISKLLAEYGIKHGPIVDSTRKLYEKKLEQAMENAPVKASSDKTYYREEDPPRTIWLMEKESGGVVFPPQDYFLHVELTTEVTYLVEGQNWVPVSAVPVPTAGGSYILYTQAVVSDSVFPLRAHSLALFHLHLQESTQGSSQTNLRGVQGAIEEFIQVAEALPTLAAEMRKAGKCKTGSPGRRWRP